MLLQPGKPTVSWAASKEGWQQKNGGDRSPLLCPPEASSGVLCPELGPPSNEKDLHLPLTVDFHFFLLVRPALERLSENPCLSSGLWSAWDTSPGRTVQEDITASSGAIRSQFSTAALLWISFNCTFSFFFLFFFLTSESNFWVCCKKQMLLTSANASALQHVNYPGYILSGYSWLVFIPLTLFSRQNKTVLLANHLINQF